LPKKRKQLERERRAETYDYDSGGMIQGLEAKRKFSWWLKTSNHKGQESPVIKKEVV
jgi:hypothetical protein